MLRLRTERLSRPAKISVKKDYQIKTQNHNSNQIKLDKKNH